MTEIFSSKINKISNIIYVIFPPAFIIRAQLQPGKKTDAFNHATLPAFIIKTSHCFTVNLNKPLINTTFEMAIIFQKIQRSMTKIAFILPSCNNHTISNCKSA